MMPSMISYIFLPDYGNQNEYLLQKWLGFVSQDQFESVIAQYVL